VRFARGAGTPPRRSRAPDHSYPGVRLGAGGPYDARVLEECRNCAWQATSSGAEWIPLISGVLVLVGGIAGVVIGARLNAGFQARHWRAQQQNEALLAFAKATDAYQRALTGYLAPAILPVTANELLEAYYNLDAAGTLVQMMSPLAIRNAVKALMLYVVNNVSPFTLPGMGPVPPAQAQTMMQGFFEAFTTFVDTARADFGEA
jgi:hypothetical protein